MLPTDNLEAHIFWRTNLMLCRGRGGARTSTNLSSINEGTANPMGIIDTSANFQLIDDNEFPEHHNISNSQGPADPSSSRRLESLEVHIL